jgi:hypothetical protein
LLLLAFLAAPAAAEVAVRVVPGTDANASQVELSARAAPLNEVLDRLGRQIGMKVVYEGASPRQLVTLSLQGRSPAETVLGVLEGQGLNYALVSDPSGTRVVTLLVAGTAPSTGSAGPGPATSSSPSAPSTPFRRPPSPPPGSSPDTIEEEPEEMEDDATFDDPVVSGAPPQGQDGGQGDPSGKNPVPVPQGPAAQPNAPQPSPPGRAYPVSPFAPQAPPYTPQPFPPLPPGVPGGPTAPNQPQQPPEGTDQKPPSD